MCVANQPIAAQHQFHHLTPFPHVGVLGGCRVAGQCRAWGLDFSVQTRPILVMLCSKACWYRAAIDQGDSNHE